jgi:hypothetical protein
MTLLLITQTFPPDPAAVGQHFGDVAATLADRGNRVTVFTAASGYHDSSFRYPRFEVTTEGVEVRRFRWSSFGKNGMILRLLAASSFMLQTLVQGVLTRDLQAILFSTSPPLVGVIATLIGMIRRVPIVYWVMDLNPDQLVALGHLKERGLITKILAGIDRFTLNRSTVVVALDTQMAARIRARTDQSSQIRIIPPWSPDNAPPPLPRNPNAFRSAHRLGEALVIMYSGNHSPSNPLDTLLETAVILRDQERLKFLFVGDGAEKRKVERYISENRLENVLSLPYQPRTELATSLSAADVHVVSLGDDFAGIVHPCKIYGAMAVGRPILYLGPAHSHLADIVSKYGIGWRVGHGDTTHAVEVLRNLLKTPLRELQAIGQSAREAVVRDFQASFLRNKVCDVLEEGLALAGSKTPS